MRHYSEQLDACRIDIEDWVQRSWPDSPAQLFAELVDNLTPMSEWELSGFAQERGVLARYEAIQQAAYKDVVAHYDSLVRGPCCEWCGKPLRPWRDYGDFCSTEHEDEAKALTAQLK